MTVVNNIAQFSRGSWGRVQQPGLLHHYTLCLSLFLLLFFLYLPWSVSFSLSYWPLRVVSKLKLRQRLRYCRHCVILHELHRVWQTAAANVLCMLCFHSFSRVTVCPPPTFSLTLSCSYFTTSNILIHIVTPRQVDDCGPAIATGEEGKYQRRSGRGGVGKVEGKPNLWWWRKRVKSAGTYHLQQSCCYAWS